MLWFNVKKFFIFIKEYYSMFKLEFVNKLIEL